MNEDIFYFRVNTFEDRNRIADMLDAIGYEYIDMTSNQAAFEVKNTFEKFKSIVVLFCELSDIKLIEIKKCIYPGLGLFL